MSVFVLGPSELVMLGWHVVFINLLATSPIMSLELESYTVSFFLCFIMTGKFWGFTRGNPYLTIRIPGTACVTCGVSGHS